MYREKPRLRCEDVGEFFILYDQSLQFYVREISEIGGYYVEACFDAEIGFDKITIVFAKDFIDPSLFYTHQEIIALIEYLDELYQRLKIKITPCLKPKTRKLLTS